MNSPEAHVGPLDAIADLQRENRALQIKLQKAEETIRQLQNRAANAVERSAAEASLRQSEARLQQELADTRLLQTISAHLIHEEHEDTLYSKITEAALTIMQSDFASMQMYYPDKGAGEHLQMLASSGLSQEGRDFWAWVGPESGTTCGVAMRTHQRCLSSDMSRAEFVVGTPDHEMFARAGVLAAQSTPLVSRSGKLLGMISTHWTRHHTPSDRDLNLLDILARQGADLLERQAVERALRQSKAALIEADRRKDEFLATLGHELRNPLSPIRNALQILRAAPDGKDTQDMLAMMDRQVAHLVRLIDDLLDVSRITQGKIELRKETIALQHVVRNAIEASQPLIESNGHALMLDLPQEPLWIHADLTRVTQVIGNLLNNAAKYTPPGGRIAIGLKREADRAVLSVADTGIGIADDLLATVFDLFMQIDMESQPSNGGLGIGLALAKQLIEMHGGTIAASSAGPNQGSTFTLRLPLAIAEQAAPQVPASIRSTMAGAAARRVLVVDDYLSSAETMCTLLELHGHDARMANDGEQALMLLQTFDAEAILLDIDLPGMDGYTLCRVLRKEPRFQNTLIIAQTGMGQERDRQLAKEAGFDHHLVKPFEFEQLTQLLATAKR